MTVPVAGNNHFPTSIEAVADGDPANGASFIGFYHLANRTKFLQLNSQLAIARHRHYKSSTLIDRLERVCWGPGAGPFDRGLFAAVGRRSGGGAGIALSPDGEQWYDQAFALMGGLVEVEFRGIAHGGSGALGSRVFAICGHLDQSGTDRPIIMTISDAADANASDLIPEMANGAFTSRYDGIAGALTGSLRSICWNGTNFVAVGDNGLIVTLSADLLTATVRTPGSSYTGDFYHAFEDSLHRLYACGENGEIQRSLDNGVTWARVHSDASLGTISSGVAITIGGVESRIVGTSDENKVLRTASGASGSWTEVTLIPTATFDGSQVLVFKLGAILCAILRSENNDSIAQAFYSFDGGVTWPYTNHPFTTYGTHVDGACDNGERAVIVGGTPDGTNAAHAFATETILALV